MKQRYLHQWNSKKNKSTLWLVCIILFFFLETLTGKRTLDKGTDWRKEADEKKPTNAFTITFHNSLRLRKNISESVLNSVMRWKRNNWLIKPQLSILLNKYAVITGTAEQWIQRDGLKCFAWSHLQCLLKHCNDRKWSSISKGHEFQSVSQTKKV